VAADGVDEVVAGGDAGTGATSGERRARRPAVRVRAVALHRAQTRRAVTTTHRVQPIQTTANSHRPTRLDSTASR